MQVHFNYTVALPLLCTQGVSLQICPVLASNSTRRVWATVQEVPYLISGNRWISYDDVQSLTRKVRIFLTNLMLFSGGLQNIIKLGF